MGAFVFSLPVFHVAAKAPEHYLGREQAAFAYLSLSNDVASSLVREAYSQARVATGEPQERMD